MRLEAQDLTPLVKLRRTAQTIEHASKVCGIILVVVLTIACALDSGRDVPSATSTATVSDEAIRLGIAGATNAGAGVAASDNRVVVSWAATKGEQTNVHAAVSTDEGRTFAAPARVNDIDGDARMSGEQAPRVSLGQDLAIAWVSRLGG